MRPRGGVVTQRTANPYTPVRFRAWPPIFLSFDDKYLAGFLCSSLRSFPTRFLDRSRSDEHDGGSSDLGISILDRPSCKGVVLWSRDMRLGLLPAFNEREANRWGGSLLPRRSSDAAGPYASPRLGDGHSYSCFQPRYRFSLLMALPASAHWAAYSSMRRIELLWWSTVSVLPSSLREMRSITMSTATFPRTFRCAVRAALTRIFVAWLGPALPYV